MCTGIRFVDDKGNLFMGRNLDWNVDYGEKVVVTPRGFEHKYAFNAPSKSANALIGPCIVEEGVPLYFDCGNEKGLGIAGLNFPGYAEYAKGPIDGKVNVAAYEFPLWVAANFDTVDDLMEVLPNVAIVAKPINDKFPISLLHWIISDAKRCIVVEYMSDGIHIYDDAPGILTNQPTFPFHMEHLRSYMNLSPDFVSPVKWGDFEMEPYGSGGQMVGLPGSTYSPDRFVRVAYMNTHYPTESTEADNVSRMFHTLTGVSMIKGGAKMGDGTYEITIYTGGFSQATNTYYMSTYEDPAIKSFPMSDADIEGTELYTF